MDDQNFDDLLPPWYVATIATVIYGLYADCMLLSPVELTTQETFTQIWPIKEEEWSNHVRDKLLSLGWYDYHVIVM